MKSILLCLLIAFITIPVISDEVYVAYYGKLYRKADKNSQLLSILDDSCKLRVLSEETEWVEVQAKGYRGWIERSSTSLKTVPQENSAEPLPAPFPYPAALGILLPLTAAWFFLRKKYSAQPEPEKAVESESRDLNILIFTAKEKSIVSCRNGGKKRISTCFREIGFTVHLFESLKMGRVILNFPVSAIAVDYAIHRRTVSQMEFILKLWELSSKTPVIFYNVPPGHSIHSRSLTAVHALRERIDDSEILTLISPIIERAERKNPGILHGTLSEEGAYELLQLIELGKKNGILTFSDLNERKIGVIGFREGKILYARTLQAEGKSAAAALCRQQKGFFAFTGENFQRSNCSVAVTELLFHIAQKDDEQEKNIQKRGRHVVQNNLYAS